MERPNLVYKRAETEEEVRGSYALRYEVFCKEFKDLPDSMCPGGLETDAYDKNAVHFIVKDGERVVGNTRVVTESDAFGADRFGLLMDDYYDLSPLKRRHKKMVEMGRTCFLPQFRGRASLAHLWRLVYQYVVFDQGADLGLSMGVCWFNDPKDMTRFFSLLKSKGFVADDLIPGRPGLVNTKPPTRSLAPEPFQPFVTAPALRMYLDIGFRVLGEPVYVEHFNEYQMLIGVQKDEVLEPYLSFFLAKPKSERRRLAAAQK